MLKIQRSNERITIHFIIYFGTAVPRSAHPTLQLWQLLYEFFVYYLLKKIWNIAIYTDHSRDRNPRRPLSASHRRRTQKKMKKKRKSRRKIKREGKRETDKSREATRKCFTWRTWPCEAAIAV